MAATIASRSSFLRPILRTATTSTIARTKISFSGPSSSLRSNFSLHQTRISPPSLSRFVRRELSTLQPLHSAVASACLVSKLPSDANSCAEGISSFCFFLTIFGLGTLFLRIVLAQRT
ncbi:hypothetical protein PVK06_014324 [Gossypium arboreum]|uniref:Protein NUCLEAR FUSION DEFECTIVE 6, chloroplastic/mitochondrial-like n=1 Tax=Gossypium arboreum TaxID=29729 RepID=A0ABR0PU88_GOSAR|nr:hypothetical protein PVK06_014324 [Gossypium arboreum]